MDITKALSYGWPGVSFSVNGEAYAGIVWPSGTKPTEAEIQVAWVNYQNRDVAEEDYAKKLEVDPLFKALALVCADQFGMTGVQMKAAIKAKL